MKSFQEVFREVLQGEPCKKRFPGRFTAAEFRDYFAKHCGDRSIAKEATTSKIAHVLKKAEEENLVEVDRESKPLVYSLKKTEKKKEKKVKVARVKQGGGVNGGGPLGALLSAAGVRSTEPPTEPSEPENTRGEVDVRIKDILVLESKLKTNGLKEKAEKRYRNCTFDYAESALALILTERPEEFEARYNTMYKACTELGVMCTGEEAEKVWELVSQTSPAAIKQQFPGENVRLAGPQDYQRTMLRKKVHDIIDALTERNGTDKFDPSRTTHLPREKPQPSPSPEKQENENMAEDPGTELAQLKEQQRDFALTWKDLVASEETFKDKEDYTRENLRDVFKALLQRVPKEDFDKLQEKLDKANQDLAKALEEPAPTTASASNESSPPPAQLAPAGTTRREWGLWHTITCVAVATAALIVIGIGIGQGWFTPSGDEDSIEQLLAPWEQSENDQTNNQTDEE